MVFDEERISKAVVAYHVEKLSVREVAESMKIADFDVIVCLLDHVWKGPFVFFLHFCNFSAYPLPMGQIWFAHIS